MSYLLSTVGIIDDDQIYQLVMKRTIEHTGMIRSILQFYDGEEAIGFFREKYEAIDELPQLILLDINMPYMNGWQFLDEFIKIDFKSDYKSVIYIVSSSTSQEDISKANEYSIVSGYKVKPITRDKFEAMMKSIVNTA